MVNERGGGTALEKRVVSFCFVSLVVFVLFLCFQAAHSGDWDIGTKGVLLALFHAAGPETVQRETVFEKVGHHTSTRWQNL